MSDKKQTEVNGLPPDEKVVLDIETTKVVLDEGYGYKGQPPGMCIIEHCQMETAKIQKFQAGGTTYAADCPYCSKSLILGSMERKIKEAMCKRCRQPYKLEE